MTSDTARVLFALSALSGAVSVAAGAFGAHALDGAVSPDRLNTWRTAAAYGLAHAVPALLASWMAARLASRPALWASGLFLAGTLVFSGSLYALVLLDAAWLGAVTPLGGVAFIAGWLALGRAGWKGIGSPDARSA